MSPKPTANKRQYSAIDVDPDAGSPASEGTTRAAPQKKTSALKDTTTKKSAAAKGPTANNLYKDSVKAIEATLKVLDVKSCKLSPNSRAISTETCANAALDFLDPLKELERMDGWMDGGLVPALNLAMYVADASHTNCDTTAKMSGAAASNSIGSSVNPCFPGAQTSMGSDDDTPDPVSQTSTSPEGIFSPLF
ncbi:hypothetical protein KCU91_g9537, partial [Aureobasidium melanogenum]